MIQKAMISHGSRKKLEDILTGNLIDGKGGEVSCDTLKDKVFGIYFSAHWCPPCKSFTPKLVETYKTLKEAGKNFEIVFASSDNDDNAFREYFKEMPWLSIPFGDTRKNELSSLFDVSGIPTFVIIDGTTGKVINDSGRAAVMGDPEGKEFPWKPKSFNEFNPMNAGGKVNSTPCLIAWLPEDSVEAESIKAAIEPVATSTKQDQEDGKDDSELSFFWGTPGGAMTEQVREKLGVRIKDTVLTILAVQDLMIYTSPLEADAIDSAAVSEFVEKFKRGEVAGIALM